MTKLIENKKEKVSDIDNVMRCVNINQVEKERY